MSEWIKVEDAKPEESLPVFLYQDGRAWVGCLDYDDGWHFGNTYGSHYWSPNKERWESMDNDWDDDYQPTHWMHLPIPPEIP